MKIQVYGKGCAKCQELAGNAKKALQDLNLQAEVEHITDIKLITEKGIMITPALVVDGKIISQGKVIDSEELKTLLAK